METQLIANSRCLYVTQFCEVFMISPVIKKILQQPKHENALIFTSHKMLPYMFIVEILVTDWRNYSSIIAMVHEIIKLTNQTTLTV